MRLLPFKLPARFLGLTVAAWSVLCFVYLYFTCLNNIDDWCYFAPGVTAKWPFGLKTSLLGNFLGSDHTWGLHWPGAPLIYSVFLPLLPKLPIIWVALLIGMVAGLACLTYRLLGSYLGDDWLAAAGATIILADRWLCGAMLMARPEILSLLTLVSLVWLLRRWPSPTVAPTPGRMAACGACFFLLPLLHPLLPVIGGVLCVYAGLRAWRRGLGLAPGLFYAACLAAGTMALLGWFWLQPDALQQFQTNARANYRPVVPGASFLNYQLEYKPFFTGVLLYALAIAACVLLTPGWWRSFRSSAPSGGSPESVDDLSSKNDWGVPLLAFLTGTAVAQFFPNRIYQTVELPLAILLALAALGRFVRWSGRPRLAHWLTPLVVAFAAVHGAFWASRTYKYLRAGHPNLRAEVRAIFRALPADRMIVIPPTFWSDALSNPGHCLLNTLPYSAAESKRLAYETGVFGQLQPGDFLIVKDQQNPAMQTPVSPQTWELVHRYRHSLSAPGGELWGYDLAVYRKRS